ncbi:MAG: Carbonic anhydrase [Nitrospirota bacterium]|jgi:carbonic anhydrase|nr:carbonic anhydrase [Nitrospira sp.]
MKKLIEGFKKFQREVFKTKRDLFTSLAKGQEPRALFISCSDSRIDPCLVTQTEPGELFILRNAGNLVPSYGTTIGSTIATIEYAVGVLNVKNIIVCGHTDCGVVKAILEPEQVDDLPAVKMWLLQAEATRRVVRDNYSHLTGDALYVATTQENVRIQLNHLKTHPLVAARLRSKSLELHGWVYSIETGDVWTYDFAQDAFRSLVPPTGKARRKPK